MGLNTDQNKEPKVNVEEIIENMKNDEFIDSLTEKYKIEMNKKIAIKDNNIAEIILGFSEGEQLSFLKENKDKVTYGNVNKVIGNLSGGNQIDGLIEVKDQVAEGNIIDAIVCLDKDNQLSGLEILKDRVKKYDIIDVIVSLNKDNQVSGLEGVKDKVIENNVALVMGALHVDNQLSGLEVVKDKITENNILEITETVGIKNILKLDPENLEYIEMLIKKDIALVPETLLIVPQEKHEAFLLLIKKISPDLYKALSEIISETKKKVERV